MSEQLSQNITTAFALQEQGKHSEAHLYFINGMQELCSIQQKYGEALGLAQNITDEANKLVALSIIANDLARTQPEYALSLNGSFANQLENDTWYYHALSSSTDVDDKTSDPYIDAIIAIQSPSVRDNAINYLLLMSTDIKGTKIEEIIAAISTPEQQEFERNSIARRKQDEIEAKKLLGNKTDQ